MKRIFINGILSAAFVATCLVGRGARFVYSQNDMTSASSPIWEIGQFEVREYRYWTDASGHILNGPQELDHPVRSSTEFSFGAHSITVPLSPKFAAIVGAIGLVILGLFVNGLLIRRGRVANPEPRTG
jgi:hypothetical protein